MAAWFAVACLVTPTAGVLAQTQRGARLDMKKATWRIVNDTVMGGRSSASLGWGDDGRLVWSGTLSLENNGGFVSIRTDADWSDWSEFDGIEVALEGQGRDVEVSVQREGQSIRGGGYRAAVPTERQGETRVLIPFSAFVPKRFGREIRGPRLDAKPASLGGWGFLIADKRPGPFLVRVA